MLVWYWFGIGWELVEDWLRLVEEWLGVGWLLALGCLAVGCWGFLHSVLKIRKLPPQILRGYLQDNLNTYFFKANYELTIN